jgi:hypothetical protein
MIPLERNPMRHLTLVLAALCCFATCARAADQEEGFVSLFDGKTLDGWTPQDPALKDAFKIDDGCILTHGAFTHLFYSGPINDHNFKNFELRVDFKMGESSNSGIFFHTENPGPGATPAKQKKVEKGYECQICGESYKRDPKKTGSLYDIEDVKKSAAKDNEWSTYVIRVDGKHIVLQVNGQTTVDYTEPTPPNRKKGREGRIISSGTFALQAHDPNSKCWFRNIRVKVLPD